MRVRAWLSNLNGSIQRSSCTPRRIETTSKEMNKDTGEIRKKAVRLFTYLKDLTRLPTATVRDLSSYEAVLWFDDVPREQGCFAVARDSQRDETEVSLGVEKHDLHSSQLPRS
jgi:hypothetical protein